MSERQESELRNTHEFTLILSGIPEITEEIEDAFYEAGCSDALLGSCNGVVSLDFAREADSYEEAVASAIRNVESAGIGARVARVEPIEGGPEIEAGEIKSQIRKP